MDWNAILIAAIAALPPSLLAWAALHTARQAKTAIDNTHKAVNSRMDEMLELTRTASKAEGVEQERQKGRP